MRVTVCDNCGDEVEEQVPTCSIRVEGGIHHIGEHPASIQGDYCAGCSKKIREAVTKVLE